MPRIDGLPAADPLTGSEPFAMMQGGKTKSATPEQILAFVLASLPLDGAGSGVGLMFSINASHLILTRTDGTTLDLGSVGTTYTLPAATTAALGGVKPDGATTAVDSNGALSVLGATFAGLTAATSIAGTDGVVLNQSGVDKSATLAQQLAWSLANDGSIDPAAATIASTLSQVAYVIGIASDGSVLRVPSSLLGGSSSGGTSSGSTTPAAATGYTITTASTGTAGTPQTVTVAANGSLSSADVVTLAENASGTFGGTITLPAGSSPSGTTQYTPASAGTRTITGTNNGGLTNPAGVNVTVAAAASGGGSGGTGAVGGATNSTPMTTSGATYADRGDGSGAKMLVAGSGTVSVTLPNNKQWFIAVKARTKSDFNYSSTPYLVVTDAARTDHQIKAAFSNRAMTVFDSDGGGGGDPSPAAVSDGNIHDFVLEALSGGGENAYIDGANVANGNHPGAVAIGGAANIYVAGDANTKLVAGVFDVRVYAGSVASPGALLYEWLFNGTGVGS